MSHIRLVVTAPLPYGLEELERRLATRSGLSLFNDYPTDMLQLYML
jgi:hypothetical protein